MRPLRRYFMLKDMKRDSENERKLRGKKIKWIYHRWGEPHV